MGQWWESKLIIRLSLQRKETSESVVVLKKGGEAFLYRIPFNVERMLELEKKNIVLRPPFPPPM